MEGMSVIIRLVAEDDLVICGELYAAAFSTPPYREVWDPQSATSMLAGLYYRDPEDCWCIDDNGIIAGIAFCTGYGTFRATIQEFAIAPEFQRRGLGTELMDYVLTQFRDKGVQTVDLVVNIDAPALDLYKKFGFRHPDRYVLMAKWLQG